MTKWLIEYKTRDTHEGDWMTMPRPAPVTVDGGKDHACQKFASVFRACFGDTLQYRILSIRKA